MPADPSIYGMIRNPQFEGPIDQYAKAATLKNLINAGELGGLQLKQTRRAMSDDEAVREAYRASGGDPAKLRDLLYGAGQPQAAMAAEKAALDARGTAAKVSKDEAETRLKLAQWGRDLIAQATPENYPQIIELGRQNGQQWAMNAPPQFDPAWQKNHVMKADDWIARNVPRGTIQDLGGSTQLVNPYSGAPMSQATPKTLTPGDAIAQQRLDLARREAAYEGVPGAMGGPQPSVAAPGAAAPVAAPVAAPAPAQGPSMAWLTPKARDQLRAKQTEEMPKDVRSLRDLLPGLKTMADEAKSVMDDPNLGAATGLNYRWGDVPGTKAYGVARKIDTMKAQVFRSVVTAMRNASKTGGLVGNMSDAEGARFENMVASLDRAQKTEDFKNRLREIVNYAESLQEQARLGFRDVYGVDPPKIAAKSGIKFLGFE